MFRVFRSDWYDKKLNRLDKFEQQRISKFEQQLKEEPYQGKPLGYKFFREKKVKNYRFYYLIYDEYVVVFVIAISDKKDQQKVIDQIKHLIPFYREQIKNRINL